jgi:deoxyribodipyrimidine photo-lyase
MNTSLLWFRQDLRLHDNPALQAALQTGDTVIPVYIWESASHDWSPGGASKWWLHHSLSALQQSLRERGSDLLILTGNSQQVLLQLCNKTSARQVFWNRCYEPHAIERDRKIKKSLQDKSVTAHSYNGSLLVEPWNAVKKDGTPYRVFTPFWKAMQKNGVNLFSFSPPEQFPALPDKLSYDKNTNIEKLKLLPAIRWDTGLTESWRPGESAARDYLDNFLDDAILHYPQARDIPADRGTSRLSPYLHFGEISPWAIWRNIQAWSAASTSAGSIKAAESYLRQLGWRDFAFQLLYHFPHTDSQPLDTRFKAFPWKKQYNKELQRWKKGATGIPIVDAGMRELWHTGWMHNRVRMIVASLLTKNLLVPWQAGAKWFWDTLVDADLANNTMGWQWTAGSGADAAPFFRIFNPVRQGERFDPSGDYVRKWVPELETLADKWIHQPWEAPEQILEQAQIQLGTTYPEPIVDLSESRQRALAIWNDLKTRS